MDDAGPKLRITQIRRFIWGRIGTIIDPGWCANDDDEQFVVSRIRATGKVETPGDAYGAGDWMLARHWRDDCQAISNKRRAIRLERERQLERERIADLEWNANDNSAARKDDDNGNSN